MEADDVQTCLGKAFGDDFTVFMRREIGAAVEVRAPETRGRSVFESEFAVLYRQETMLSRRLFIGEDVDFIKICTYSKQDSEIEIWKRELRDKVIWKVLFEDGYKKHYFIDSMYTSLSNKI